MTRFRLLYSDTSHHLIRRLHPDIKPFLKKSIEKLRMHPYQGKALIEELSGYYSLRFRRYRVIYRIDETKKIIEVHYVGHRRDIYEEFRKLIEKRKDVL